MISQTAEYALRAAVHLARHEGQPVTGQAISEATVVPPTYLLKILAQLTKGGVVKSQRGPNGGFTLARSSHAITALDVVAAVDSLPVLDRCPLGLAEHSAELCPLHARLQEAVSLMRDALRRSTLHDLRGSESSLPDACRFPAGPLPLAGSPAAATRKKEEKR